MPDWLERFIDLLLLLFAWITGRRYRSYAQRTGRLTEEVPVRRFIIVQIDGLAHEYLLQAVAKGQMPALQRLIAQGYRLQRWRCGIPSSTPAIQAGIMYGNNWDIPGFRWYEKDTGSAPHCKSPYFAERLKASVANGRPGILTGGSSYTNLLDGDAKLALFTLSAMGRNRFLEHLRGLGWALLFALIPWRIGRIVILALWELLRDVARTLALWTRNRFRTRLRLIKPALQVLTNVVFAEVQTFGVLLDIYRGVPAIYVNYYGYDEVAHNDGPLGKEALRALRRIDSYIGQIERLRKVYYPTTELYIFSDHGMTPAIPLQEIDPKKPLGRFVADYVRASVVWEGGRPRNRRDGHSPDDALAEANMRWLLDELDGIEPHLSRRGQKLAAALRRRILKQLPDKLELDYDLARGGDVIVRASGSLAHIYFNVSRARMEISEIALLYADLLDALNNHPGIGMVLGLEKERPVIVTSRGIIALTADSLPPGLPEPERTAADLARLLSFPHSGDLVVLGAWSARGRVVTFEEQVATHGGAGGPQDYPFFLTPPGAPLDVHGVTNACQLYSYFTERFLRYNGQVLSSAQQVNQSHHHADAHHCAAQGDGRDAAGEAAAQIAPDQRADGHDQGGLPHYPAGEEKEDRGGHIDREGDGLLETVQPRQGVVVDQRQHG